MTAFASLFKSMSVPVMQAVFGESVVYRPFGGTPRTITALVDRQTLSEINGVEGGHGPSFLVEVVDDETTGIGADELNTGRDEIQLPDIDGRATLVTRHIMQRLDGKGGKLVLEVR